MTSPAADQINLYYTEGSSDKVYQLQLEPKGDGWVVNFQYGRRGSTLKADTKTKTPVDFATARKAYDQLLKEKTKKGYTPDQTGSRYQQVDLGERFTGVVPQLLNPVRDQEEIETLLRDPSFYGQEKHDGERRSVQLKDEQVCGANRDGLRVALPQGVVDDVRSLSCQQLILDGEIMGERFVAFDILELNGENLREKSVEARLAALDHALGNVQLSCIEMVKTAKTEEEKRALAARIASRRGEGVVFKSRSAPYVPGRPASGGNQRKWKFVESATVRVASQHKTKRSVALECIDGDKVVALGNCTVPQSYDIPKVGALVEVEYLYLYRGGSLYQPQYKGERADKSAPDALTSFKLKADVTVDEDDPATNEVAAEEVEVAAEAAPRPRRKKAA